MDVLAGAAVDFSRVRDPDEVVVVAVSLAGDWLKEQVKRIHLHHT